MDKVSYNIIRHKKSILAVFLVTAAISAIFSLQTSVNYNMVDYLPGSAQSTTAIKVMEDEFGGQMPNARVMLTNVSIMEAMKYKKELSSIDGITSVKWLDDLAGIDTLKTMPPEFPDIPAFRSYYKDNNALMTLSLESGKEEHAVSAIYKLIGQNNAVAGEAVNTAQTQSMSVSEVKKAMIILLPVIIIILILTTASWLEPLLFLFTIGIAIIMNMGTNIIFGQISFITRTVSPVLQLAVSLDYAIFLLHSFRNFRRSNEPEDAMKLAMKQSIPTVAASAATTVTGFAALMFMRFGIGADLGLNLLKGVLFSFISVMVLLPVLTLIFYKYIDKTMHKRFVPDFGKAGSLLMKLRNPFLLTALAVVIPCFTAQLNTQFMYGMSGITEASRVGRDASYIEERFGRENMLVLLVPKGNTGKEAELSNNLAEIPHVTGVVSYAASAGPQISPELVPKAAAGQFYSEHYARIIMYTDMAEEGAATFNTIQAVRDITAAYYGRYFLAGQSATLFDMKKVVSTDTRMVNLIAISGIFAVLLITFRSLSLPLFLIFSIETAIWINLAFPYFTGKPLSFIGYLIIITVQLGATVDYAILFTNTYLNNRREFKKKDAMRMTIGDNLPAVLTSASILATAGFTLAFTSSNPIISGLGILLGRGTLFSLVMVACVLPALLVLFDDAVRKTTLLKEFR